MSASPVQIVGLGYACVDVVLRCEDASNAARGLNLSEFALEGGGPVATALAAAAKLGVATGFIGVAGTDAAAEFKLASLERYGVDVSRVIARPGPEPQIVLVWVDATTGERTFSGLAGGVKEPLRPDELDRDYIVAADCLHLDGCHLAAAAAAARWMREAGKTVVLDAGATRGNVGLEMRALVEDVDVLICGSGFAPALTGEADVPTACRAARVMGPRLVVQTDGADGCWTVDGDEEYHTPAFEVDVIDTTGAGDVFHGAYMVGMLRGWPSRQIAHFASAVAAIKCGKLGGRAGICSFAEAVAFCRERGIEIT